MKIIIRRSFALAALLLSLTLPAAAATKDAAREAAVLDKAVQAMGGAAVVDAVTTLELHGDSTRYLPNGEEWALKSVSYYAFPDRYRQEATLPIGENLITMAGPDGAFLQTGKTGGVPLPDSEKQEITKSILRNPLILLQRRQTLKPVAEADQKIDNKTVHVVRVDETIGATHIAVDPASGEIRQITYPVSGGAQQLTITYTDYRSVGKLRYPFMSSATVGGKPAFSFTAEKVTVNEPYDAKFFVPATVESADAPLTQPAKPKP